MNKFPKNSQEYQKRHKLLMEIDKNFPDRKINYNYIDILRNAEEDMDQVVKLCVKKEYWWLYGVE